jgi:hypothetical protein
MYFSNFCGLNVNLKEASFFVAFIDLFWILLDIVTEVGLSTDACELKSGEDSGELLTRRVFLVPPAAIATLSSFITISIFCCILLIHGVFTVRLPFFLEIIFSI